jgi:hypothetical protein
MPPGFPVFDRRWIKAEPLGHLPLRQAECPPRSGKALRICVGWRKWVVTQEPDNGRDVADGRSGCVAFPVANRQFVNADPISNLALEELEVQAARADMVA